MQRTIKNVVMLLLLLLIPNNMLLRFLQYKVEKVSIQRKYKFCLSHTNNGRQLQKIIELKSYPLVNPMYQVSYIYFR